MKHVFERALVIGNATVDVDQNAGNGCLSFIFSLELPPEVSLARLQCRL